MDIGQKIRMAQDARGISCVDLARKLDVLPQQLSRWRHSKDLKLGTVIGISSALGLSVDELISFSE
jgi:transcriptional regulator with XRE-family HTH domain